MRQSTRIAAIYHELRQVVGLKATAAEVLACAASLVELFNIDDSGPVFDLKTERQPSYMVAVDEAWADGGWSTLSGEWDQMGWESSDGCGGVRPREWLTA